MTDSTLPTPGPIPFARKGEASPAVKPGSQPGPATPHAPAQGQPAPRPPAEIPAEEPGLAMLTSLIRRGPHKAPARRSDAPVLSLSHASPWSVPAGVAPRARVEDQAPTPLVAGLLTHRTPSAPSASHVALNISMHRRRQLTLRLTTAEFARFHAFAMMTRSTYQGILASSVRLFLDTVMPVGADAKDKSAVEHATETRRPGFRHLP